MNTSSVHCKQMANSLPEWHKLRVKCVGVENEIFRLCGVNNMPAHALAEKVARASAGMVLVVLYKQHILLFNRQFHLLLSSQIRDTIQNVKK